MRQTVALNRSMKDDYHYNEAIKTLRTNIQFCGSGIRVIMMTSALPDEGKSDMAFALASSLAQIGKRVLLIDADIRKSVLVSRYQLEDEVCGLSQYLSGQKPLEEIRYATSVENLHMIFSGPYVSLHRRFYSQKADKHCGRIHQGFPHCLFAGSVNHHFPVR